MQKSFAVVFNLWVWSVNPVNSLIPNYQNFNPIAEI